MISIQRNMTELEKADQMRTKLLDCYIAAINNIAHYAVEVDAAITAPHRQYLANLAAELADATPAAVSESRSTLRGLVRDYRDKAAHYLAGLRNQMSSTAQALRQMVEGLSQYDEEHSDKLRAALLSLREAAESPEGTAVGTLVKAAANAIEHSLEEMRKQHKFTIAQLQTEMHLLHGRIDTLEAAAATDEASKMSSRRFLAEYLAVTPVESSYFLILRMRGLGEARARFGAAVADEVVGTFGRRLRNTVPKDAVIGRWSEQDFLAIVPAALKPADDNLVKRFAEHLSMPYACMIGGKVVRVPITVSAESLAFTAGTPSDRIQARVVEAFQE